MTGTVTTGGTTAFSTWNAQTATGATTLSTSQIPSHNHSITNISNFEGVSPAFLYVTGPLAAAQNTGNAGSGGSHTHSLTQSLKYYDFIIASKD